MATMVPERSRTLHNFSLPPRLNWGTQKLLRCAKIRNDTVSDYDQRDKKRIRSETLPRNASFHFPSTSDDQIHVIREKLMLDLRSEVDKMRAAFLGKDPPVPEARPWNLRNRRAACEMIPATATCGMIPAPSTARGGGGGGGCEIGRAAKLSVCLRREEIEDDFVAMMGRRPSRKPKKRPRYVQKQLDTLFPGLWLSEITADMYKVNENSEVGK